MHHPACKAGFRQNLQAPKSSSRSSIPLAHADRIPQPAVSSSTAQCKFEMLRPQDVGSADSGRAFDTEARQSGGCAETPRLEPEDLVSVDSLLSAVQKSLMAHGQKASDFEEGYEGIIDEVGDGEGSVRPAVMEMEASGATQDESRLLARGQRSEALTLTRAEPSSSVSLLNFNRRSSSVPASLPCDYLKHVHEEIFSALRQKFHTVSMIFGYLNSRVAEEQGLVRGRPASSRAGSARKNAIGMDDFKSAVSLLGLGLPEEDIAAVYKCNSDVRTGELTFNCLQRALKSINGAPTTARALPTLRCKTATACSEKCVLEMLQACYEVTCACTLLFQHPLPFCVLHQLWLTCIGILQISDKSAQGERQNP